MWRSARHCNHFVTILVASPLVTLRRRAVLALCLLAGAVAIPHPAGADTVEEKRQQAARIADQIEQLEDQALSLGEQYGKVSDQLELVTAEVESAKLRVAKLEGTLTELRGSLSQVALNAYVYGGDDSALTALLTGEAGVAALERSHYAELLLQGGSDQVDEVETVTEDATRERQRLEAKLTEQEQLQESLSSQQEQVEAAIEQKNELQAQVQGELAELVAQEQARRAAAVRQAAASGSSGSGGSNGGGGGGGGNQSGGGGTTPPSGQISGPAAQPSGPGPGTNVPSPSGGAGGAVAAAMSQLGVGYRYATAIPGVAFDCSGLTRWAWGQAGVGLPSNSRAQAAATPDVPRSAVAPGDLIFYYSPISHVGIYIGGGQLVHATRPGDVVKVAAVNWGKVVTIGRPG
jgi:peptidoglycan DL-endopeptidase CwlO